MKNECLIYLQLSQGVKQDWCFLGKILTDMVPVFLHCCILTERKKGIFTNKKKQTKKKSTTFEKMVVYRRALNAKIDYLTITLISKQSESPEVGILKICVL